MSQTAIAPAQLTWGELEALLAKLRPMFWSDAEREMLRYRELFYLYAIQAGDDGPVKLGKAKSPAERLLTLQTANAAKLHGLAAWPGLPGQEEALLRLFSPLQIRGEWFRPDEALLEFVLFEGGTFCDWEKS